MIRPVALAIVLALVGCQSADVQRAQPTLTIPAAAGRRWPGQPGGGRMVAQFS